MAILKYKDPTTGNWIELSNAVGDTLPIGAIVEYDGENVPANWEQVSDYSTEETNTGSTWINGKPIYKKVVSIGSLPNKTTVNINHGISNIEYVVNSSLTWYDTVDNCWWQDRRWDSATILIAYNVNPTTIWINGGGVNWSTRTKDTYVTIEYTKTTD